MHVIVVEFTQLFQEDEGEYSVWTKTSIIRSKTFPQTEESFTPNKLFPNILQNYHHCKLTYILVCIFLHVLKLKS